MKYYLIAGEASGDLHGARLIEALLQKDPNANIRCWGGDLMEKAGGQLIKHYRDLAFMGFWEVLTHLYVILKNMAFCKKDILAFQPDVIVYIDYPGFNLRIAKWAKKHGFQNHYYISPQVWAWKANRVQQMKQNLTALYTILPFEKKYFAEHHQYKVDFVGHPLLDSLEKENPPIQLQQSVVEKPVIALLPGSRKQEVQKMLPLFLDLIPHFTQYQFVVAGTSSLGENFYKPWLENYDCQLVIGQTYPLLHCAQAAIVTSGTATLETALFNVPQLVCYKTSSLSYWLAKRWVKLEYISLVNLILDKNVVQELIQQDFHPAALQHALEQILSETGRKTILDQYKNLRKLLDKGGASQKTADRIVAHLT